MISILVADQDIKFRQDIEACINVQEDLTLLDCIVEQDQIVSAVKKYKPDVLVLDFMKPDYVGLEVVQTMTKQYMNARVIVVSDICHDSFVSTLAQCNVDYYLIKPFESSLLLARIRQICSTLRGINRIQQHYDQRPMADRLVEYFLLLGIPSHFKGYHYLMEAITLVAIDNSWIREITKRLYPIVGRTYGTTPSQVERSIRHAIEMAWDRGDIDALNQFFPYTVDAERGKPTNASFIAQMADIINYNLREG